MRGFSLILAFVCMCIAYAHAHEANKAYFNIVQKDTIVEIEAEFPWTIRNALLAFNPQLEKSARKKDFSKSFFEYLQSNLILTSGNGNPYELLSVRELQHNGHSHQANYLITYKGKNLEHVSNTVMSNISKKQVNYHNIFYDSNKLKFTTNNNSPSFDISHRSKGNNKYWWWLVFVLHFVF